MQLKMPQKEQGFSLIEILIAVFLFAITFLGLAKLLSEAWWVSKEAESKLDKTVRDLNEFENSL